MTENDFLIRELLDESPIGVAVVETATRKRVFVNRASVQMFGAQSAEQLLLAPLNESWARPTDLKKFQQFLDAGESVVNFEAERRRLDGTSWWALMNSRPIVFEGKPARVVWHTDITESKQAQAASRLSEERLLSAIEALEDGFVLYDTDDRFVVANQKYRDIYPKSAEFMIPGTPFETILRHGLERGEYDTQGKSADDWIAQRMAEHQAGDRSVEQKLSNGTWLQISERKTERGELVGFRVNVTALKDIQEQLKTARDAAEAAVEVKSAFLATMSHEIRTPLGGILGLSDILISTNLTREQDELVRKLKAAGSGLLVILNDILDLSKLEAGKLAVENIDFDLTGLIDETIDLFSARAQADGITLSIDKAGDVPDAVHGDPTRIRQVLINLIGNAVKFTHQGKITLTAQTAQTQNGPGLRFEVRDTGIGIAANVLHSLFDDFVQADASTSRRYAGTGLGLAISRQLVELMGGAIGVESVEGKGSVFYFEIPTTAARDTEHLGKRPATALEWLAREPLNILIAEDNEINQMIINTMLTPLGHTFSFVGNGREAVDRLSASTADFDLVLMDIRMPEMSGIEATRLIRALDDEISAIPIIALTADAMSENRKEYADAGMDDCVTKPIDRRELMITINAVIGRTIHITQPASEALDAPQTDMDQTADAEISDDVLAFLSDIDGLTKTS
jgi:PAS domain S-box-containing protein